jgi:riboflavin biosynthesis pyrimidine reductase
MSKKSTGKGHVSTRRRAAAVTVLSSIAADENAPSHSRVRAAAALVAAANREESNDATDPKGKRGRPTLIVLPDNGRDGERAEISRREDGAPVMVIATNKADLDRLEAEALAELDAMFPNDER